ncbi:MAG: type I restriction endonuclease subunit R [Bacteroidaceae bacterium]|nr:type I restriction endonuclease subunit R [Bacteroidaceae bacterium]
MPTDISEKGLETIIVSYLRDKQGYEEGKSEDFNKDFALDTERVKRFITSTQLYKVKASLCFENEKNERQFFTRLAKELSEHGVTDILRKGFKYNMTTFDLYNTLPSELNPAAQEMYKKNIFCVTRQLYYSKENKNSIDVMLSLNGLPIMTMELKNHFTGQTVNDAVRQYRENRNPKDPLLAPKRCAVHFAVDDDEIKMCTSLCGKESWFLPFNKGVDGGAGNPVNPNGLRTAYLWEEILAKESLSDILENYAQVMKKAIKTKIGKSTKTSIVWPRYHQLDAVRKLLKQTKAGGLGQRFLIQHSAGSGKSNSITWLAYQLAGLLDNNKALMDSVIVVTDRVNLDGQIKENIKAFARLKNIVGHAEHSDELLKHLQSGKKIIITTIHKFPFILDAIGTVLKDKHFGIIIDEAHSSQSGSLAAQMNIALSGNNFDEDDDLEDRLNKIVEGRKMLKNANYYAFTATPKNKTLEMFGTPTEEITLDDGEMKFMPFHEYTMKQAIEEGFIMDVLQNYTTFNCFYDIIKITEDDPEFEKKHGQKAIRAFVEEQPDVFKMKASVIVNHFLNNVIAKGKVGGQARAMVVTESILNAINLYEEIKRQLEIVGSPFKLVVAFSGTKEYGGREVSEADINGFPSSEIEDRMNEDPYRILVVADKFQTGYDQPLLHTMYVDKKLSDVKAVQTLSRLNRCHPKKKDTFVLDFSNDVGVIQYAFQRYYKTTILSGASDPNKLNDLIREIEEANIYTEDDVKKVNELYLVQNNRELIDPIIDQAVDLFNLLDDNIKVRCKSDMKSFVRTYQYIASITPYSSTEYEMLNTYYMLLITKLPLLKDEGYQYEFDRLIEFDHFSMVKEDACSLQLDNTDAEINPIPVGIHAAGPEPEMISLSDLLDGFDDIKWKNKKKAMEQFLKFFNRIQSNESFANAARNSNKDTARLQFDNSMLEIATEMIDEDTEFTRNYIENRDFMNYVNNKVFNVVYNHART